MSLPHDELIRFSELEVCQLEDESYGFYGRYKTDTPNPRKPGTFKHSRVLLGWGLTHAAAMKEGTELANLITVHRMLVNLPRCYCEDED